MLTPQKLDGKFNVDMSILWCAVLGSCWIFLKTFYIHARKCVMQRQDNHQDGKHRDLFDTCFSGFCRATLHQLKRCTSRVDSKLMNV